MKRNAGRAGSKVANSDVFTNSIDHLTDPGETCDAPFSFSLQSSDVFRPQRALSMRRTG